MTGELVLSRPLGAAGNRGEPCRAEPSRGQGIALPGRGSWAVLSTRRGYWAQPKAQIKDPINPSFENFLLSYFVFPWTKNTLALALDCAG